MKKHWLKIDGSWREKSTVKAWENLMGYVLKYPNSKLTVYNSEVNLFHKFFCLECEQDYQNLDLDCNSMFDGSLIHLNRKPADLTLTKDFMSMYAIYTKKGG